MSLISLKVTWIIIVLLDLKQAKEYVYREPWGEWQQSEKILIKIYKIK